MDHKTTEQFLNETSEFFPKRVDSLLFRRRFVWMLKPSEISQYIRRQKVL